MRVEALTGESIEQRLYDHCLGASCPTLYLLEHAAFPPGWVERFDELLSEAKVRWGGATLVPKPLVAALYFASFFPEYRYEAARVITERSNEQTERDMAHLRAASSLFMFASGPLDAA